MAKEKWSQEAVIPNANSSTMICVLNGYGVAPNNNLLSPVSLLSGETAERIAADTVLNNAITGETANRIAADAVLNNAITGETANRIAADAVLNNAITGETANRIAADAALNNIITGFTLETANRIAADTALNNAITGETANRIAADAGLQSQINAKSNTGHTHYQLYEPNGTTPFVYTDNGRNFHIDGNIIQSGSTYETHAEKIFTTADTITLRDGSISGLANDTYAGLIAKLYDGVNDGELVFDNNGVARVGDIGNTQPIATREEAPINGNFVVWNSVNSRFETTGDSPAGNYLPLSGGTVTGNQTITGTLTPKYIQDISGTTGTTGQVLTTSVNGVKWGELTPNIGNSYWNGIHSHRTYFSTNPQDKYIPIVHSYSENTGKHMISFEIYSREFTHNLSYYGKFFLDCRSYEAKLVCLEYNSTGLYAGFFNPSKIKASYSPSSGDIIDITIWLYSESGFGNDGVSYIVNVIGEDTEVYSTNTYYTTSPALSNEITLTDVNDPAIVSGLTGTILDCVYNGLGGPVSTTNLIGNLNADLIDGYHIWSGTQLDYDAIVTKSPTTIYLIT